MYVLPLPHGQASLRPAFGVAIVVGEVELRSRHGLQASPRRPHAAARAGAVKTDAIVVRRNRVAGAFGSLGLLLVPLAIIFDQTLGAMVGLAWPFLVAAVAAWAAYWRPSRTPAQVQVEHGALRIDATTVRAVGTLSRGDATILGDGQVRVDLRALLRLRVRLEVQDIATARELLAGLGLDRRAGTSKFRIRRLRRFRAMPFVAMFGAVPFTFILCTFSMPAGLAALAFVLLAPIVNHILGRVELTVGADGLDFRAPHRRVFLPHARIRKIAQVWPAGTEVGSRHDGELVSWGLAHDRRLATVAAVRRPSRPHGAAHDEAWPWDGFEAYLGRPLREIRAELGLDLRAAA